MRQQSGIGFGMDPRYLQQAQGAQGALGAGITGALQNMPGGWQAALANIRNSLGSQMQQQGIRPGDSGGTPSWEQPPPDMSNAIQALPAGGAQGSIGAPIGGGVTGLSPQQISANIAARFPNGFPGGFSPPQPPGAGGNLGPVSPVPGMFSPQQMQNIGQQIMARGGAPLNPGMPQSLPQPFQGAAGMPPPVPGGLSPQAIAQARGILAGRGPAYRNF